MGGQEQLSEEAATDPVSPYGAIKCVVETACTSAPLRESVRLIWARSFNHLGPGQGTDAPVASWAKQVAEAEQRGGGAVRTGWLGAVRDFVDVRDIADAYLELISSDAEGVFNVCSGEGIALREVVEQLIMAGGRGSRLAPYTTVLPKPLMPLSDRPIIDVIMRQLVRAGMEEIDISVGHLGGLIEAWIRHDTEYEVPIKFLYEDEPLGTAGAMKKLEGLQSTFLAMNGDILTTMAFDDLVKHHQRAEAIATMAINERTVPVEYGVVHSNEAGLVKHLEEKPTLRYVVSMGAYAFDPRIMEYIGPGERIDFPDLLTRCMEAGERVTTYRHEGYWRDIGNRGDYEAAIVDFSEDPERFLDSRG
jgi:dTDP-glucose pyrophosphorylase